MSVMPQKEQYKSYGERINSLRQEFEQVKQQHSKEAIKKVRKKLKTLQQEIEQQGNEEEKEEINKIKGAVEKLLKLIEKELSALATDVRSEIRQTKKESLDETDIQKETEEMLHVHEMMSPGDLEDVLKNPEYKHFKDLPSDKKELLTKMLMGIWGTNLVAKVTRFLLSQSLVDDDNLHSKIDKNLLRSKIKQYLGGDIITVNGFRDLVTNHGKYGSMVLSGLMSEQDKILIKYMLEQPNQLGASLTTTLLQPNIETFLNRNYLLHLADTINGRSNTSPETEQGFGQKAENFGERVIDGASVAGGKILEGGKQLGQKMLDNPGKSLMIGGGITVGAWLLHKIFGSSDKEVEENNKNTKKKKKKTNKKKGFWSKLGSGVWKVVKIAGLVFGGVILSKELLDRIKTGKWPLFKSDTKSSNKEKEKAWNEYKEKNPEQAEVYTALTDDIINTQNLYYQKESAAGWDRTTTQTIQYEDTDGSDHIQQKEISFPPKELSASTALVIDNTFHNTGTFLSEKGLDYQITMNGPVSGMIDKILSRPESLVKGFVSKLPSFQIITANFPSLSFLDKFRKRGNSGMPSARKAELELFFRSYSQVLVYMQDKRVQLEEKMLVDKITHGGVMFDGYTIDQKVRDTKSTSDKLELLKEMREDEDFMKAKNISDSIERNFLGKSLREAFTYAQKILGKTTTVSKLLQADIDTIDDKRTLILGEHGKYLDTAKTEITQGKLSPSTTKKLKGVCQDLDTMVANPEEGLLHAYFNMIFEGLNLEDTAKKDFLTSMGYDKIAGNYQKVIKRFKDSIENKTVTKEDITNFQIFINKTFAFQKEMMLTAYSIQQVRANTDLFSVGALVRLKNAFLDTMNKFATSVVEFRKGNYSWHGAAYIGGGLVVSGGIVYGVGFIKGGRSGWVMKTVGTGAIKLGTFPVSGSWRLVKQGFKKMASNLFQTNWVARRQIKKLYNAGFKEEAQKLFQYHFMNGNITNKIKVRHGEMKVKEKTIVKLAKKIGLSSGGNALSSYEDVCKYYGADSDSGTVIRKYISNKKIRRVMMSKVNNKVTKVGKAWSWLKSSKLRFDYRFIPDNITYIKNIDMTILEGGEAGKVFKTALLHIHDSKVLKNLATLSQNAEIIKILNNSHLTPKQLKNMGKFLGKYGDQVVDVNMFNTLVDKVAHGNIQRVKKIKTALEEIKPLTQDQNTLIRSLDSDTTVLHKQLQKSKEELSNWYNKLGDEEQGQIKKIANIKGVSSDVDLSNINKYKSLVKNSLSEDDLVRRIVHQWNIADKDQGVDHFANSEQIKKARAYAKKLLDEKKPRSIVSYEHLLHDVKVDIPKQLKNIDNTKMLIKQADVSGVSVIKKMVGKLDNSLFRARLMANLGDDKSALRRGLKDISKIDELKFTGEFIDGKTLSKVLEEIDSEFKILAKESDELLSGLKIFGKIIKGIL